MVTDAEIRAAWFRGRLEYDRAQRDGLNDAHWWLHRRVLDDGRVIYLVPLGHGLLQLAVSAYLGAGSYDEAWYYEDHHAAWRAALEWQPPPFLFTPGPDEPAGWYRHPATGRRRRDGTAATEYYQR